MAALTIDPDANPDRAFRIDVFAVPDAARAEFEAATHRNLEFITTLTRFLGHLVFERADGPSTQILVGIVRLMRSGRSRRDPSPALGNPASHQHLLESAGQIGE